MALLHELQCKVLTTELASAENCAYLAKLLLCTCHRFLNRVLFVSSHAVYEKNA